MRGFNDKYFEELTRVIEEVEEKTTAEIRQRKGLKPEPYPAEYYAG